MRFGALALAVLAAIGCSDSSGPSTSNSPSALAQHLDSLYVQACAVADTVGPYGELPYYSPYYPRCLLLSVLLAVPASGSETSPLVVQGLPGNGWRGAVIDYTDTSSNGAPHDSNFVLIAYADPDVHTAFVTDFVNGQAGGDIVIDDDTVALAYANSLPISTMSRGGRCVETAGLTNPLLDTAGFPQIQYSGSICQLSTFSVTWNGDFNVLAVDSLYAQVNIPTQTVNGITLTNSPWGFYAQRALEVWLRKPGRAITKPVQ
jgi:hypothetical protein